jgi:hypothetical protein
MLRANRSVMVRSSAPAPSSTPMPDPGRMIPELSRIVT